MEKDIKTVIDFIAENIQTLTPTQVTEFTCTLSICYGRLGDEIAVADRGYAKKWLAMREVSETATAAKMRTQTTEEYRRKKKLEYYAEGLKELIHALKKRLVVLGIEHNNSGRVRVVTD